MVIKILLVPHFFQLRNGIIFVTGVLGYMLVPVYHSPILQSTITGLKITVLMFVF